MITLTHFFPFPLILWRRDTQHNRTYKHKNKDRKRKKERENCGAQL